MAKLQSNHRFYKLDIKPAINYIQCDIRLQDYNIHLVQTQDETLGEATLQKQNYSNNKMYWLVQLQGCKL